MSAPDKARLLELATACEKAIGPDRYLLELAYEAINGATWSAATYNHRSLGDDPDFGKSQKARRFGELVQSHAFLDAAMMLVPEDHFWAITMRGVKKGGYSACCQAEGAGPMVWYDAKTADLALCAAAFRAIAARGGAA